MKTKAMVINHETAMSLWSKRYGKANKVKDFAGREMLKAAYNDRNSEYGWNVDHIFPQSKGGKTTESNLICCHILTNDEKGDKFPCFTANGKQFEIIKVENHYEIREKNADKKQITNTDTEVVNFYDATAGVRFFKTLKGIQNKRPFVGTVVIELDNVTAIAIVDFIRNMFSDKMISFDSHYNNIMIYVVDYNMPQKENTADMLERCIVLNTYLSHYFKPMDVVDAYNIFYGEHREEDRQSTITSQNGYDAYAYNSLYINELVVNSNENAAKNLDGEYAIGHDYMNNAVYKYDYIKTKLAENLDKQVK